MHHTFPLKARQVHATIFFVITSFTWKHKKYVIGYETQQHEHRKVFV
jgi:hypothetical protein